MCCFIILALKKATTRGLKRQPTQATKIVSKYYEYGAAKVFNI